MDIFFNFQIKFYLVHSYQHCRDILMFCDVIKMNQSGNFTNRLMVLHTNCVLFGRGGGNVSEIPKSPILIGSLFI